MDAAGAGLRVPVRPADHVRRAAGGVDAGGAAVPDAEDPPGRAALAAVRHLHRAGPADQGSGDAAARGVSVAAGPVVERLGAPAPAALVRARRAFVAAGCGDAAGVGAAGRVRRWRGVSATAAFHADGRPRRRCAVQGQGSAEPRPAGVVVPAVAAGPAVSVQRLAACAGGGSGDLAAAAVGARHQARAVAFVAGAGGVAGIGRDSRRLAVAGETAGVPVAGAAVGGAAATAAGAWHALRAVLAVARLLRVFADQRQAALLPAAGAGRRGAADRRLHCRAARAPSRAGQPWLAGHLAAGRGRHRVRAAAVRHAAAGGQPRADR